VAISVVGVAGVLAFSVSGRTREFGVRMAIGSQPGAILSGVLREGAVMAVFGIVAGAAGGYALARVVASFVEKVTLPGALPIAASAVILLVAAVVASLLPAAKAARVDVIQALRSE
jgi:ABC-type antimicrobial peptide transport system permease subunit